MGKKGVYSDPLCQHCGETDPDKFYKKMKSTCYSCHGRIQEEKRVANREWVLDQLGGKCQECGYDHYRGALELHHTDPTQKDVKAMKAVKRERLLEEAKKCVLLCANCHRTEHARLKGLTGELPKWS